MSYCEQCAALQRQNDFLANDRDGYVQSLTDENNKLRAQVNTAAEMLREAKTQNTDLTAEIERLRAALEYINRISSSLTGPSPVLEAIANSARAALNHTTQQEK